MRHVTRSARRSKKVTTDAAFCGILAPAAGDAMKATAWATARVALAVLALCLPACGGSSSPPDSKVEILHWWTAGGEKDAIDSLLDVFHQQFPRETASETPVDGSDAARMLIQTRMIGGDPPDTFQANGGWDLLGWVLYNNMDAMATKMDPVDPEAEGWGGGVMPQAVLQTVSYQNPGDTAPTVYGVPLDIHRINTLFYNRALFDRFDAAPPSSLDDVFSAAAALQAAGMAAPIALGGEDGALPLIFFENLLVSRAGAAFYRQFMLGLGDPFAPEIATAVDDLATLLTYANANSTRLTWNEAANRVVTQDAAMMITGDWGKAFLVKTGGLVVNVDFRAMPTPGTKGTFVFTTDTFGLPKGGLNRPGATDMLSTFGSNQGQDTFNPIKGSISPRTDTNTYAYDDMGKQTSNDFKEASANGTAVAATAILAPRAFIDQVNTALLQFVVDGNKSTVIHTIANYYDLLQNNLLRNNFLQ
jgi:glucose/mannose transport system substrate-binding protein